MLGWNVNLILLGYLNWKIFLSIRKQKGVWILNILNDSLADKDGRLRINDRILEINCQDIKNGSKNDALKLISVRITLQLRVNKWV